MQCSLITNPASCDADTGRVSLLQDLLERMQAARYGSLAFDAAIVNAFAGLPGIGPDAAEASRLLPGPHCSTILMDVVGLLPADYNFSLGRRDGVCWAWIQPNDDWRPADGEARHDHPGGSGLAVAKTPILAVACAAIRLHIRLIEQRQRSALHRLLFVSRATLADPEDGLVSIVALSRFNNARDGITGVLLLFADGFICQVLEGACTQLDASLSRIRDDKRHTDIRVLQAVPIRERRYPGWPMGFATKCRNRLRLGDCSSDAAQPVLDFILELEYQKDHWIFAD